MPTRGLPEGWFFEQDNYGEGFWHECPGEGSEVDESEVKVELIGETAEDDLTRKLTYRLTCTCGATCEIDEMDYCTEP